MNSKKYVGQLANQLSQTNQIMNSQQLAAALNAAGCKTTYNTNYKGGRGTDKLKSSAYNEAQSNGDIKTAKNIAEVFVDKEGETPWCYR